MRLPPCSRHRCPRWRRPPPPRRTSTGPRRSGARGDKGRSGGTEPPPASAGATRIRYCRRELLTAFPSSQSIRWVRFKPDRQSKPARLPLGKKVMNTCFAAAAVEIACQAGCEVWCHIQRSSGCLRQSLRIASKNRKARRSRLTLKRYRIKRWVANKQSPQAIKISRTGEKSSLLRDLDTGNLQKLSITILRYNQIQGYRAGDGYQETVDGRRRIRDCDGAGTGAAQPHAL